MPMDIPYQLLLYKNFSFPLNHQRHMITTKYHLLVRQAKIAHSRFHSHTQQIKKARMYLSTNLIKCPMNAEHV